MSTTRDPAKADTDAKMKDLRDGIEQTRQEMSETVGALEERLNPDAFGEKAKAQIDHLEVRMKSAIKEGIEEAKIAATVTLKEGVVEAKQAITHGLKETREAVKSEVAEVIARTKHSVREATLGRAETFATKAGDVMNDTRDTLVDTIRQNPVPAAIAGIGIVWLFMNRSSANRQRRSKRNQGYPMAFGQYDPMYGERGAGSQSSYGREGGEGFVQGVGRALSQAEQTVASTMGNAAHRVGDVVGSAGTAAAGVAREARAAAMNAVDQGAHAVGQLTHDARDAAGRVVHAAAEAGSQVSHEVTERANHLAHQASEAAGQAAEAAHQQAMRVESSVASAWETNPLAFGAAALLVGATMGYALPRTQKEDELVGELRDQVVHQAAKAAGQAVQSLEHMAEDAGKAAKNVVSSAATS